jgi:hypothetical protein
MAACTCWPSQVPTAFSSGSCGWPASVEQKYQVVIFNLANHNALKHHLPFPCYMEDHLAAHKYEKILRTWPDPGFPLHHAVSDHRSMSSASVMSSAFCSML